MRHGSGTTEGLYQKDKPPPSHTRGNRKKRNGQEYPIGCDGNTVHETGDVESWLNQIEGASWDNNRSWVLPKCTPAASICTQRHKGAEKGEGRRKVGGGYGESNTCGTVDRMIGGEKSEVMGKKDDKRACIGRSQET